MACLRDERWIYEQTWRPKSAIDCRKVICKRHWFFMGRQVSYQIKCVR